MHRPKSAHSRNEQDLQNKAMRQLSVTKDPAERLRLMCLTRGSAGILGFGRVFRRMDDDNSKTLSYDEFIKGIHDSNIEDLTDQEVQNLFDQFDRDKNGTITYDEFLRTIRPPMSESRQKVIMEAFRKLDASGDGKVTIDDLKNVYSVKQHPQYQNGEMTQDQILKKFLAGFETGGIIDGVVTEDEFLDYYSGVSASIDSDVYFDLMMRNAWKL